MMNDYSEDALVERPAIAVYRHVYDSYAGQGRSVYGPAA